MKVTLDLEQLLKEGSITHDEYKKLNELAAKSTSSLAFSMLIGFGVVALSGATLAMVPAPMAAVVIGALVFVLGLLLLQDRFEYFGIRGEWSILANICLLLGALLTSGGILAISAINTASMLGVTALLAFASVISKSGLLASIATLVLSASIGSGGGYTHASYFIVVEHPLLTIILFSMLSIVLYQLAKVLPPQYEGISITASRTGVLLVNFGFLVGSVWGDRLENPEVIVTDWMLSLLWGIALFITAIWAWRRNRRWVLNTVAVFGSINFYTQWFERLGLSPYSVFIAGLIMLLFALWIQYLNAKLLPKLEQRSA